MGFLFTVRDVEDCWRPVRKSLHCIADFSVFDACFQCKHFRKFAMLNYQDPHCYAWCRQSVPGTA